MKGTDVTPEQLAHAEDFVQRAQGQKLGPLGDRLYMDHTIVSVSRQNLIRLLAWYGAIRAKSGSEQPRPLVHRCPCANPGVDLMTSVCDCVTPVTTRCECHATDHEFHDPRPEDAGSTGYPDYEATDPACSRVEAESVAMGQTERAALHIQPNDSTHELMEEVA